MNERLQQLAREAGHFEFNKWDYFDIKKFAELIVGHATECVREVLRDENSDLSYTAATQVQNRIKEHFGVE